MNWPIARLQRSSMIKPEALAREFQFPADFAQLFEARKELSVDQAARLLCLKELYCFFGLTTAHEEALKRLYFRLEWVFQHPPSMTYDLVVSPGMRFQIIPRNYIGKVETRFPS